MSGLFEKRRDTGVKMSEQQIRIRCLTPEEEMIGMFSVPKSHFPDPAGITGDVAEKHGPKRKGGFFNEALLPQRLQQTRRKKFT
jgi:hypothetical protein